MKKITKKIKHIIAVFLGYVFYSHRFFFWGNRVVMHKPDLLHQVEAIKIGDRVEIRKGARLETIGNWDQKAPKIIIGDRTSIHMYFHCGASESVIIGNDVLIASRVFITDHSHNIDCLEFPPIRGGRLDVSPVVIEDEVWIGEGAVILKGVTVGRRAVIGANAVVTKDVLPCTVVGGVPAKLIRKLGFFNEDT